jgi:hypothetical protein
VLITLATLAAAHKNLGAKGSGCIVTSPDPERKDDGAHEKHRPASIRPSSVAPVPTRS